MKTCGKGNFEVIPTFSPVFSPLAQGEAASKLKKLTENVNDDIVVFPGFCDVHVHFREPGFSFKETILKGSMAAAHGGYTTVFTMPNLNPVPDSKENLMKQLEIINRDGKIEVIPYGAITVCEQGKELVNMAELAPFVIGFSDDGKGVQDEEMMEKAMVEAKLQGKVIAAHCEVNSLLNGGCIHDGEFAKVHGYKGISSESEWRMIERDCYLAKKTGASYHVCHISTKESVEIIRKAKNEGVDVTCETAPHYLVLDDGDLQEDGRFKMNPPLRGKEDRLALIEGVKDGTIDMIATDHAPHTPDEKSRGLEKSPFGIVGLETAFRILYTELVKKNVVSLEKIIDLLVYNPRKRFGLKVSNEDFTVWNLSQKTKINKDEFLSQGKATPFEGKEVYGKCLMTVCGGKVVYECN